MSFQDRVQHQIAQIDKEVCKLLAPLLSTQPDYKGEHPTSRASKNSANEGLPAALQIPSAQ